MFTSLQMVIQVLTDPFWQLKT